MTGVTPGTDRLELEAEFERAWADTANTRARPPDHDVNRVLAASYRMRKPLVFTRTMLWDVEVRKAYNPAEYIPFVVGGRERACLGSASRRRRRVLPAFVRAAPVAAA